MNEHPSIMHTTYSVMKRKPGKNMAYLNSLNFFQAFFFQLHKLRA